MIEPLSAVATGIPWHQPPWDVLTETVMQGRVPHAMLILGADGVGKFIFAQRFAAKLLCESQSTEQKPCGNCRACLQVQSRTNPALRIFEPEEAGKQLKVETIRELTRLSSLAIEDGKFSVYIIKSAGTMNNAAANALLKTLEEPVSGLVLLLLAESTHQLPATILSRCQKIGLPTPPTDVSAAWLRSQNAELDADLLLRVTHGAPLTALGFKDTDSVAQYHELIDGFFQLSQGKLPTQQVAEHWLKITDLNSALNYLLGWVENMVKLRNLSAADADNSSNLEPNLKTLSKRIDLRQLFQFRDKLLQAKVQQRNNLNAQLVLDDVFVQWTKISLK